MSRTFVLEDVKFFLLLGDIDSVKRLKPIGVSVADVINAAIDISHTKELDAIGERSLSISRRAAFVNPIDGEFIPAETDGEFRDRLKRYSDSIGSFENTRHLMNAIGLSKSFKTDDHGIVFNAPTETVSRDCSHQWKTYVGLNQSFDYCTVCDQKRNS